MAKKAKPKKVIKKRGVKPGTKRGRYRKPRDTEKEFTITSIAGNSIKVGDIVTFDNANSHVELSLCQQLEETITRFENRIGNSIGRLNQLMGKI